MRASASSADAPSRAWTRASCTSSGHATTTSGRKASADAVLDDERRLVAGERLARAPRAPAARSMPSAPMRGCVMALELRAGRRVGEDDARQRLAVEPPVRRRAPPARTPRRWPRSPSRPRRHDLARERVGVDDRQPAAPQPRRDGALARGDAARESEEVHGACPSAYTFACRADARGDRTSPKLDATAPPQGRRRRLGLVAGRLGRRRRADARLRAARRAATLAGASPRGSSSSSSTRPAASSRPTAPATAPSPRPTTLDVAGFVDGWVARMDARVRRDLGRFLGYVEHLAPVGAGFGSRFTRLGAADQDAVLASVEASSNDLLRAGFDGLKSLVFMGYYRDPRTWGIVGYDGPLVGPAGAGGGDDAAPSSAAASSRATSTLDVDAVVVGTGAGGSIALRELARAGLDARRARGGRLVDVARLRPARGPRCCPRLFQDMGGRATEDMAIRVLQGRGVGGSTVHNTNLCKRTPDAILDLWAREYGVSGASPGRHARPRSRPSSATSRCPRSPRRCATRTTRCSAGACEALGWTRRAAQAQPRRLPAERLLRARVRVRREAERAQGASLPQAVAAGARVYSDVEALQRRARRARA